MIMTQHGRASGSRSLVRGQQGRGIDLKTAGAIGRHIRRRLRNQDHSSFAQQKPAHLLMGISISVIEDLIECSP